MNSLEYINKLIKENKKSKENWIRLLEINPDRQEVFIKCAKTREEELKYLQQIKTELEVIEIIKFGCTGLKYNSDGGSAIKLGNINAMDFVNLSNRLEEICDWSEKDD